MIEKGSLIETRRGMFRVIDTRTLFNPFTEKDETEYIIDDNGVKRKVYESDIISEVHTNPVVFDEDKKAFCVRRTKEENEVLSKIQNERLLKKINEDIKSMFPGKSVDGDGLNYSTDPNVMA